MIDIDIIFYNDVIIQTPTLKVPHPQMQHRRFVLVPIVEIAPQWMHPVLKKSMTELLAQTADTLEVHKVQ